MTADQIREQVEVKHRRRTQLLAEIDAVRRQFRLACEVLVDSQEQECDDLSAIKVHERLMYASLASLDAEVAHLEDLLRQAQGREERRANTCSLQVS